ncbi:type II toxin-antitoxin system PemK/MazF family toxin [Thomasclavelia cocleata]|uniref:type II toxin-antitoxin system PemK/MazF family toxin n=1 Tax=Thomasclavelia cocleata TaxID=69824 RepID=UPI00272EADDB|nr:type II toxin-antitoxin system PemK/MazF family toxin [Thomasclavelia cocleata]
MKQSYINCLKKLREFRKNLKVDKDVKRGKLYFTWIKDKTQKIANEKDENYIYKNIVKYSLHNFKIDDFNYKKANKALKRVISNNYIVKKNYHIFNNPNISFDDTMLIMRKFLLKRGNVVWIDFGFNIGNEFGGMHPAVILKNFDKDIFVLPVSSKRPIEYEKIEKEFEEGKISQEECIKKKDKITEIVQLDNIIGFKEMIRWANITRMRKVSILRLNFSGTIGRIDGKYINKISSKISQEFGV